MAETGVPQGPASRRRGHRSPGPLPPLTAAQLRALAERYVARYSTTQARLTRYLQGKLRQRGCVEAPESLEGLVGDIVAAMSRLGGADDEAFAAARARALAGRGYGPRRIEADLRHAGVEAEDRPASLSLYAQRMAAVRLAQRRRLGPFAAPVVQADPAARKRAFAALIRGGHGVDIVRDLLRFNNQSGLDAWLDQAREEEENGGY